MAGPGVRRDASCDADGEPGDTALTRAITLPGEERSVANGRRFVREMLGLRHPAFEKVALGVSELATNAIKHTPSGDGGEITISLSIVGQVVRAEVTNDGTMTAKPHPRTDTDAEHGRGILIIDALADAWGVVENAGTTMVWAEFCGDGTAGALARARRPGRHT
jgi:anti-sigma regulatory factor (Ser/Thr protein kinase)